MPEEISYRTVLKELDRCAFCIKPEGYLKYADSIGMSNEDFERNFPCNRCSEQNE